MNLKVLSTGSSGNCYLLETQGEILILDCGVSAKEVKKALNFNLSNVVGCFVSHTHADHAGFEKEFDILGIPMLTPYKKEPIRENRTMGGYFLQAFKVPHGETPNYGLLIRHKNGETTLYITDFSYCQYSFKACRVNHFIVEVNYQHKYVDMNAPNYKHKIADHCSLKTCKEFVEINTTDAIKNVICVHLGLGSCEPIEIINEIEEIVPNGVFVDCARAGKEYQL